MSIAGSDVESVSSSRAGSAPGTTRNPVKFLCSHGGKILPRPADGRLKYVGGETRIICVPRDITFHELMKKLSPMFNGEMILKYQLIPEDLDVLITVKSDEDIRHMIEECDQHDLLSAPKLRAFLFSSNPIVIQNQIQSMDHISVEQRYINSINGNVFHPLQPHNIFRQLPVYTSYTTFTISSACSSPRTLPETTITAATNSEATVFHGRLTKLPRNHSSPSLCNIGLSDHQNPVNRQQPPQLRHFHPHQPPKPPLDRHPDHKAS
ncbi:hypothetical protein L2E82_24690 [Cichorium intybus]|uniref:Uncharacterized protein n=1 Tax=Cichorium intybus TaxID=13427 RepID=A0ACB9E1E4_CICIN|nr:hypothetical protein L2E82_24690 [Cichorium intybus]